MTYAQTIEFLYELRWFGAKFGLENTLKLAELSGNPHCKLRFIHVAGTNGKGSVCAMLESIYRSAGLRVGLFTSPHLVHFSERIQVNREPIAECDVVRLVSEIRPLLAQFPPEHHPTFFEVVTVMALRYFHEKGCDLVLWETGLGGRLDATNIVRPMASVVTTIQYDHEKWLGNTLASIAGEKAGIIKPGVPVITGVTDPEPLAVIEKVAAQNEAPLHKALPTAPEPPLLKNVRLPLHGAHQRANARVALKTVEVLKDTLPVAEAVIVRALEQVYWPGRLQRVERSGGQIVLLDAAHNPAGAEALAATIRSELPGQRISFILGILQDKDYATMCKILAPLASKVLIVPVHSERAAPTATLADACSAAQPGLIVRECASLKQALEETDTSDTVVIAGSLYLAGEAMELLGVSVAKRSHERRLNEWGQQTPNAGPARGKMS